MKYTPEYITYLQPNEVFVFGANEAYIHGAGAAKLALKWGAKIGKSGLQGQTYGIPTKDSNIKVLPLPKIKTHIEEFIKFSLSRPDLTFLVTRIGTGLSGYHDKDIAPLFPKDIPKNIILPASFADIIYS